jgi:glycine/D-amino acid oxidase-like deaminating enzyme
MVESAARRVPMFADAGIAWGVTGVYDMTPDTRPLLGTFPGLEGLVVATGFSGMGFKISPAVGEAIAEIATSGAPSRIDLRAFRPTRFDEGEPIESPFPGTVKYEQDELPRPDTSYPDEGMDARYNKRRPGR